MQKTRIAMEKNHQTISPIFEKIFTELRTMQAQLAGERDRNP
jgi:hypothetical protein